MSEAVEFAERFSLSVDDVVRICRTYNCSPEDLDGIPHPKDDVNKVYVSYGPGEDDVVLLNCVEADEWTEMEESQYSIREKQLGTAVERRDGGFAVFLCSEEAEEAKKLLDSGEKTESDYYWSNDPEPAWDRAQELDSEE